MERWLVVTLGLFVAAVTIASTVSSYAAVPQVKRAAAASQRLILYPSRALADDLEIEGLSPDGSVQYVRYADLLRLPLTTTPVLNDPNFAGQHVRVTGVMIEVLEAALGVPKVLDLMDAQCTDRYRGHYPADYVTAHHPILGLKINGVMADLWARAAKAYDPSPYFITYGHFVPAFRVLSHQDEAQVPGNVVRLHFSTTEQTFGGLKPTGPKALDAAVQAGFLIAKQNCLRCHSNGQSGGTKSGVSWQVLSVWASEQPRFFSLYVLDPTSIEPHSHMAGSPQYDEPTRSALVSYFASFMVKGNDARRRGDAR